MSLSELDIKKEYRNLQCDVIKDFYIPILRKATQTCRRFSPRNL